MFDVGFSELILIGVVALLVLGPERLPKLARDVGRWVGRARRYMNHVREEIDREVELSELRRLRDEIESKAREAVSEVDSVSGGVEEAVRSTLDDVAQPRPHSEPQQTKQIVAPSAEVSSQSDPKPRTRKKRAPPPQP